MKTWKRVALVNLAGISGIALSAGILPGRTPFWVWAASAATWLVLLNVVFSKRPLARRTPGISSKDRKIILFVLALLAFNILLACLLSSK